MTDIDKVLYYIEDHLDEELSIDTLAKVASYSKFHFSRLFKMYVGESVSSYITRLRLEKASFMAVQNASITDLAMDVGFQTHSGFNKAFKKMFNQSPSQYRIQKISFLKNYKKKLHTVPEIVYMEEAPVLFCRAKGDYGVVPAEAWKKLTVKYYEFIENLSQKEQQYFQYYYHQNGKYIGICHDDPSITKTENIRYDACVACKEEDVKRLKKEGFSVKSLHSGRYVKVDHTDGFDTIVDSFYGLYGWIEEKGYKLRDCPAFEKYINFNVNPSDMSQCSVDKVEIYAPIE